MLADGKIRIAQLSENMTSIESFRALLSESDRGCVLIIGEQLSEMLKELHLGKIEAVSAANSELRSKLFSGFGPLSTFSSRCKLGYAYGLISKETFGDIESVRDIRNAAAHSTGEFSFPPFLKQILAIKAVERNQDALHLTLEERAAYEEAEMNDQTLKIAFISTAMAIGIEIQAAHLSILNSEIEKHKRGAS